MKFKSFLILFFVLILGLLVVSSVSATNSVMIQYEDYVFGIDYSQINYEAGFNYYNSSNIAQLDNSKGSSLFNGSIADGGYDNNTTFIVVEVTDAKYRNLGVAGGLLDQEDCLNIMNHKGDYSDKLEVLPFCILEGISEPGVYCNINMVPSDKSYEVTDTIAAIETRRTIHILMLPRFVLDNFDSARDAAYYIRDYCNVLNDPRVDLHMMITDNTGDDYVLEFFDGKVWINETLVAMSKFYNSGILFNENGTVEPPKKPSYPPTEFTDIDVYGLDDLKVGKESEITVFVNRHGKGLPNTQVCIDIFSDKNELLYSSMGYTNDAGIFTFKYTPSVAGKQSLVVSSKVNATVEFEVSSKVSKTVDFEVSSNETSNQTVSAGTIPMQATGNSLTIALVLFILILSLGYITYRKDNI